MAYFHPETQQRGYLAGTLSIFKSLPYNWKKGPVDKLSQQLQNRLQQAQLKPLEQLHRSK